MDDDRDEAGYASPACQLHEADAAYRGYLPRSEVIDLLNRLLEAERAGAGGVAAMAHEATDPALVAALREVAGDEARFCAMLAGHVARLGGTASAATGAFREKLMACDSLAARIALLDRGQGWVVREIEKAQPKIEDAALHADLKAMLATHVRNIARLR